MLAAFLGATAAAKKSYLPLLDALDLLAQAVCGPWCTAGVYRPAGVAVGIVLHALVVCFTCALCLPQIIPACKEA